MESNSEKNRIHMSELSALLLDLQAPTMSLIDRGLVAIKGVQYQLCRVPLECSTRFDLLGGYLYYTSSNN
jgi:hypothetical protein